MVSLTKVVNIVNTKQHYLTYISIISRGISSFSIPPLLHTLNSILSVVVSFNVLRNHGMLGLVQQVDSGPLQFCPSHSVSSAKELKNKSFLKQDILRKKYPYNYFAMAMYQSLLVSLRNNATSLTTYTTHTCAGDTNIHVYIYIYIYIYIYSSNPWESNYRDGPMGYTKPHEQTLYPCLISYDSS